MQTAQSIFEELIKARGIQNIDGFIKPNYETGLHSPLLLPDMPKALKRLELAKNEGQKVAIYGDYDIDGLTATTILLTAFKAFGVEAISFIPDRYVDGYGLSKRGLDDIKKRGASLVVTVDCGSRSVEEIKYATELGLDVIVTDHHEVGDRLPDCVAVVNAKRNDNQYPFKDLAGCGVAFKLVQAMQDRFEGLPKGQEKWLLDLVAFGTVCDVVDLVDENRVLVAMGLKVLRQTRRPGFRALAQVSKSELEKTDVTTLGFRFGPRLNAAGRLETAQAALELLTTTKGQRSLELAEQLDALNQARRTQQAEIVEGALAQAAQQTDDPVIVVADPNWQHGIVGIVAARLVEELQKPAFVMQEFDGQIKGSARSFGDFHLADALKANQDLLISGGGHAFAAGATIKAEDFEKFRQGINEFYKAQKLKDQSSYLKALPDVELTGFAGMDENLLELLEQLEPFGRSNPQPVFAVKAVQLETCRPVGKDGKHAKLRFRDSESNVFEAIAFGLADKAQSITGECTPLCHLEWNEWNG